jgi:hypothetical protein
MLRRPTSIEFRKTESQLNEVRGKQGEAGGLVDDLHTKGLPSKQTVRGARMMFISFSPLAAFPHITPKLRASICYAANRNGHGGPVRLAC